LPGAVQLLLQVAAEKQVRFKLLFFLRYPHPIQRRLAPRSLVSCHSYFILRF
jgi:hypothetical protein